MIKLVCRTDKNGIVPRMAGDIVPYHPWPHEWQGMTEPERVAKGIYVHCYGQGEFEIFTPEDSFVMSNISAEEPIDETMAEYAARIKRNDAEKDKRIIVART